MKKNDLMVSLLVFVFSSCLLSDIYDQREVKFDLDLNIGAYPYHGFYPWQGPGWYEGYWFERPYEFYYWQQYGRHDFSGRSYVDEQRMNPMFYDHYHHHHHKRHKH
ncbi:MAG: hypothetical protein ACOVOR_02165 [Rhabdochlamydiaceae bacterium]